MKATHAKEEAKGRILFAAQTLFAASGFAGTSVNDIAQKADVNKALIYYYFPSKEAILDELFARLHTEVQELSLSFIRRNIVSMIHEARLDILQDRFHFASREDLEHFIAQSIGYYKELLSYAKKRKKLFKILLLESLKDGKHHGEVFKLFGISQNDNEDPTYKELNTADEDFAFTEEYLVFRFFFTMLPLMELCAYSAQVAKSLGKSQAELDEMFLHFIGTMMRSLARGNDLFIKATSAERQ